MNRGTCVWTICPELLFGLDLNLRPLSCKSNALTAMPPRQSSNRKNQYLNLHTLAAIRMSDAYGCKWSWHSCTKSFSDIDADCASDGSWRPLSNNGSRRPITSGCSLNHSEKAPAMRKQVDKILTKSYHDHNNLTKVWLKQNVLQQSLTTDTNRQCLASYFKK